MDFEEIRRLFLPWRAEREDGFREEVPVLAKRGLHFVAGVEIVAALIAAAGLQQWSLAGVLAASAAVAMAAAWSKPLRYWRRAIAAASAASGAALAAARNSDADLAIAVLLILTPAAVPVLPVQALAIGVAAVAAGFKSGHPIALTALSVLATVIAALFYDRRRAHYHAASGILRDSEDIRRLQARLQRAEATAAMVQVSAALAHELEAPMSTVANTLETLLLLSSRRSEAESSDQLRLTGLQANLGRVVQEPLLRLRRIVARLERLSDAAGAAVQKIDLNDLIRDAATLVRQDASPAVQINLDLEPLPQLACRPQQLVAVLCNVLTNSVESLEGKGRISVSSRANGAWVEERIEDNGRGISAEHLAQIYDPAFLVAEGQTSATNWSLYTSRQFIKDHGGELRVHSHEGSGARVSFILPRQS